MIMIVIMTVIMIVIMIMIIVIMIIIVIIPWARHRASNKTKKQTRSIIIIIKTHSGVARPWPTRACALPSTFQALPLPPWEESHDFIMN